MAIEDHIDEFALNEVTQFGNIFYVKGFLLVNESYANEVTDPVTAETEISVIFDAIMGENSRQGVFNTVLGTDKLPGNPWEFECYFVVPYNRELINIAITLSQPSIYDGEFNWNNANKLTGLQYEPEGVLPYNSDEVTLNSVTVPETLPRNETVPIEYELFNQTFAPVSVKPEIKIGDGVVNVAEDRFVLGGGWNQDWFGDIPFERALLVEEEIEVPEELGVENLCIDIKDYKLEVKNVPDGIGDVVNIGE